jgi:cell shape-determining protein MreD
MKWWNSVSRWALGILFLIGAYTMFIRMLITGVEENEITKAVIGALLSGTLVPGIIMILQFYFRRASDAEKKDSTNVP